jgi:hypothetical protein
VAATAVLSAAAVAMSPMAAAATPAVGSAPVAGYGWGANVDGDVGDGTRVERTDGTFWAWGPNANGILGVGTTGTFVTTPAQVVGLTGVTQATAALGSIVAVAAAPRPTRR